MKKFLNTIMCIMFSVYISIVKMCKVPYFKHLLKDKDRNSNKLAKMLEKELDVFIRLISFLESHDCTYARLLIYLTRQRIGDELLIEYYDIIYDYKTTALKIYAH